MPKKFVLSDDFLQKLVSLSKGFFNEKELEQIISVFESEANLINYFTFESESNLLRIISASFDPISLLNDCIKYPHHSEILISISANSNFLSDICVSNPEYLYQIFNSEYLNTEYTTELIENEVKKSLIRFKSQRAKLNFLRSYKRRQILRIGIKDILGLANLETITYEISILAKTILKFLFEICFQEIQSKYGLNITKQRYTLCALGKLGGDELNYSSDVDLILFYDKNSKVGKNKKLEYFEVLSETVQLFIKTATEVTEKGFIYRIDFRLRPDGQHSPLCRTLSDFHRYYESRGEDWERQMLLKLSFISGNKNLYESFTKYLQGFIFPSSFSESPLQQIKRLKTNIESKLGNKENIKLFVGGIRDIEFSIQALQLLNGRKYKDIRTGTTLTAIRKLHNNKFLSTKEKNVYEESYKLYRRTEHFLQLMNDSQTHDLPSDKNLLEKLAGFLGFQKVSDFSNEIQERRKKVRSVYNSITKNTKEKKSKNDFNQINFSNKNLAEKNYKYLKTGIGLLDKKEFDSKVTQAFINIEENFINFLSQSLLPDVTIDNFSKVIKVTGFPSIWYSEFSNTEFFTKFLIICEQASSAIDLICNNKKLAEFIISRKVFQKLREVDLVKLRFDQIKFILAIQFVLKIINVEEFAKLYAKYINNKIEDVINKYSINTKYFIAGMGSFGLDEMNLHSDVDLIVVTDDIKKCKGCQKIFQNFLNELKKELTHLEIDFRLRPEGNNSPLVTDIKGYKKYIEERIRVWEIQSLSKLKFVCGDQKLFINFSKLIIEKVKVLLPQNTKYEMSNMFDSLKKKTYASSTASFDLKKSPGGLLNVEFILQSIILTNPIFYKELFGKSTREKIYKLSAKVKSISSLEKNFEYLKNLELYNQITFNTKNLILNDDGNKKQVLANLLGHKSITSFDKKLNDISAKNSSLLNKHLK